MAAGLRGILGGGGAELLNVGTEIANRVAGAPALVANLGGYARRKRLRVCAVVLRDGARPLADEDEVLDALRVADAIFKRQAGTELVFDDWPKVHTVAEPAPAHALDVSCGRTSWREDLADAGAYFRSTRAAVLGGAASSAGAVTGYGEPVAVFVVRDIAGKAGCSMGPLSDYVTVDRVRGALIAHELGHCCGLWHTKDEGNLMLPAANREAMTRTQRAIFRNSRHVTFR
jgi:hypothetical protein